MASDKIATDSISCNPFEKLHPHIVLEILKRTNLTTLDTCERVCKSWKDILCNQHVSGYLVQNTNLSKYLHMFASVHEESRSLSSSSEDWNISEDMKILACHEGLLFCQEQRAWEEGYELRYYVCKPATKQLRLLPAPKLPKHDQNNKTVAVAIIVLSSNPLRYKIVILLEINKPEEEDEQGRIIPNDRSTIKHRCKIFDSKFSEWETSEDIINLLPTYETIECENPVHAGNSVYWRTSHCYMIAFNEPEGTFQRLPLPKEMVEYRNKHRILVEYREKLGLVFNTNEATELWVMYSENPTNKCSTMIEWRKEKVMDVSSIVRSIGLPQTDVTSFYDDRIIVLNANHEVAFYNLEDSSYTRVEMADHGLKKADKIFRYRSDLEHVNLGVDVMGLYEPNQSVFADQFIVENYDVDFDDQDYVYDDDDDDDANANANDDDDDEDEADSSDDEEELEEDEETETPGLIEIHENGDSLITSDELVLNAVDDVLKQKLDAVSLSVDSNVETD